MVKKVWSRIGLMLCGMAAVCVVGACNPKPQSENVQEAKPQSENAQEAKPQQEPAVQITQQEAEQSAEQSNKEETEEPLIHEVDYSAYFDGMDGCAVFYMPDQNKYEIYNNELAQERHSPCSTFKIISTLTGLKSGVIDPDDSVRSWSGETFWNEDWNRDIGLEDAFRTSCVWYYREVIDEIGADAMEAALKELSYGNEDCSDWGGGLNANNRNPALTGFWIESSLNISPKEQTEVLERIFGSDLVCGEAEQNMLKSVMLVEQDKTELPVYGKTGMGKLGDTFLDVWFTGMLVKGEQNVYFAVYLGETDNQDMSSAVAKEIALRILSDHYT